MAYIYSFLTNGLKRYGFITILLFGIFIILLMNLGRFFDITEEPKKADIIVYLGGGGPERIKKALELYKKGYSKTDKLIFTGSPSLYIDKKKKIGAYKKIYFTEHGIPEHNLVHIKSTHNTMKEVLFVKNYMLQYDLKSVMFVSDPPHSRRIMFLANLVADYSGDHLSCFVVGSNAIWWSKEYYFLNRKGIVFVLTESIKSGYNFIAYVLLEKLGLLEVIKKYFGSIIHSLKKSVNRFFYEMEES